MLIEKEKIQKAKEKLGDRNAELIAELMNLQGYDEQHHKSLCPLHNEDTPSFVYDPKRFRFHCFGCGKNVDLLDAYMSTGLTYIGAAEKLFEQAKMNVSLGEWGVRDRRDYRYPTLPPDGDKTKVYEYLALRKISKKTVDAFGLRQDEHGNIVFPFYDSNDVAKCVKYRPSRKVVKGESKMWFQKGSDFEPLLWNMNRINVNEPLLISEGEIDAMSLYEAGFTNVTSVPNGANNTAWLDITWDWLNQFEQIIICPDNDVPGQKMVNEIAPRLGAWRVKVVNLPTTYTTDDGKEIAVKDANEVLYWYGAETLRNAVANAHESPVSSVVDFTEIQDVNIDELDGIYTGIREFDSQLMRLFYSTFNILTGVNGSGKSSFLLQLVCQAMEQGKDAWVYSKELPNYLLKNWTNFILAGGRNVESFTNDKGTEYYKVKPEAKAKIDEYYKGRMFIYKDEWSNGIDDVMQSMEESVRRYGVKLLIIDNLTAININSQGDDRWEKQVEFVNYLISFAKKFNVVVLLVIHPKKIETMRRLTKFDVQGLGSIVDLAHRLLSLYRVTKKDKEGIRNARGGYAVEPIKYDVLLDVLKDRLRGYEGASIGLYYDKPSRRFYTTPEEFDYQYEWDDVVHNEPIDYPPDLRDEEVFGHCG